MKLPPFAYATPSTLEEAISLLTTHQGEARPIAGGQSLIPILAFRLAGPSLLVDLRKIPGLNGISITEDGVRLGALVRWCDIEAAQQLPMAHPLLVTAIAHVGHYHIRNRGTVGGSLAHADPAAELPGIAVTCDAELAVAGPSGMRTVRAADFFLAPLMTALAPDELVVELGLPPWPASRRWAFEEYARQRGAFALAGIALFYDEESGLARNVHIGVIGASSRLHRITEAEDVLNGQAINMKTLSDAAHVASQAVDPVDELDVSAEYRRALVKSLVERALKTASTRTQTARS